MQYIPAALLWTLALIRLPHARNAHGRHVFWAAFCAAVACTLYSPNVYLVVDAVLGGHNLAKLATLITLMLGFWQFRSAVVVAVSTDQARCRRRLALGRWVLALTGIFAVLGFLFSRPVTTSANLQVAYADEPGMKLFLLSGSSFLVWAGLDLMVTCMRAWRHMHSRAFRAGFLVIAIGCAASCLAITDRVLYGAISHSLHPTTTFTAFLDSTYWPLEVLAVMCIGIGLILPAMQRPVGHLQQSLEARALLVKLRPAWLRATAARREDIIINQSSFELLTPLRRHAKMHLHRRFIEIRDGEMLSGDIAVLLPGDIPLLERAESLLRKNQCIGSS
ncbi:hypothetical protein CVV68_16900 [Arthrobacter livingstonensis]|uniref:Uncharacterized protein n=1 Tax=Arthrobacter livingstonensis TaxID=670078 RepID=A0A2V5L2W6_9MICC|nr:MAB_1171c family putative transporter [Arthrobacter livingstonensis]PYI65721.1 hypothetical protein CVV68_16900 [Arthrobacter livingstonensis]